MDEFLVEYLRVRDSRECQELRANHVKNFGLIEAPKIDFSIRRRKK